MCTGWSGHGAPSEGRSLTEWSAALPDLHVKQAALTPPLLHSCLFPHVVILSAPPPPISIILTLSPSIHTGLVLCLDVTAASLSFFLSLSLRFKSPAPVSTTNQTDAQKGSECILQYRPLSLRLACWAYAHRHHNNHNKHNRRGT